MSEIPDGAITLLVAQSLIKVDKVKVYFAPSGKPFTEENKIEVDHITLQIKNVP